jgi:acyl-coenzyme A synthetase/AMP-(fatty) acid ligase
VIGRPGPVTGSGEEANWSTAARSSRKATGTTRPDRRAVQAGAAASRYGGTAVWSGDRVTRDADGLLHFVGRRDAMIKSAGNRISPQEIEEAVLGHGPGSEAAAVGVPDPQLGQAVHLIVRGSGDDEALRAALRRELPNFMQPRSIRWVERMPLNPNGKIDRAALQAEAAA